MFFAKLFDPEGISLDTPEPRARELVEHLEAQGAQVVFLTSRPHTMKEATEQWLAQHALSRPCHFKNYGTGKPDPEGRPDVGDRYLKTAAWKAREVVRIVRLVEEKQGAPLSSILFVDDEEANRLAVADLGDPRILIRYSLEDAATHDFKRHTIAPHTPPFLRRILELALLMEQYEAFTSAQRYDIHIPPPPLPEREEEHAQQAGIMLQSWKDPVHGRLYQYKQLYAQRNELSEVETLVSLQATCDPQGRVTAVRIAKPGPGLSLLELEEAFPAEKNAEMKQRYADEWIAQTIEEFGEVEAARAGRGMQLFGERALNRFRTFIEAKQEAVRAALSRNSHPEREQA